MSQLCLGQWLRRPCARGTVSFTHVPLVSEGSNLAFTAFTYTLPVPCCYFLSYFIEVRQATLQVRSLWTECLSSRDVSWLNRPRYFLQSPGTTKMPANIVTAEAPTTLDRIHSDEWHCFIFLPGQGHVTVFRDRFTCASGCLVELFERPPRGPAGRRSC